MTTTPGESELTYHAYSSEAIVTGEGVSVELPVASVLSEVGSRLIDLLVTVAAFIAGALVLPWFTDATSDAVERATMIAFIVGLLVVAPVAIETITRGRSIGKYALGLCVVRDDGGPITLRHSVIRQLVGYVEFYLFAGGPAVIAAMLHPRAKRLGDMAAGTYVISIRNTLTLPTPPEPHPGLESWARSCDIAPLPTPLAIATRQFLSRANTLSPTARASIGHNLVAQLSAHVAPPPPAGANPEWVLRTVMAERRGRDLTRLHDEAGRVARLLPRDDLA